MSNMLRSRNGYSPGYCDCSRCVPRRVRRASGSYRAAEKRAWPRDEQLPDPGVSWMQDSFDDYSAPCGPSGFDGEQLDALPYWVAIRLLEGIFDDPDHLPDGFDGTWSSVADAA